MEKMVMDFYNGKRVLITGHTGFKGSWLSQMLLLAGAKVTGYSLAPNTSPNLFEILGLDKRMDSVIGDVRDYQGLKAVMEDFEPEIVFHLAAQPLVRESYMEPQYTYETNVMGTVNLMECIRTMAVPPKSVLNVTTDKVYLNREWEWGYREDEPLDGFDPYSNSKSCSELVTHSYINSFFKEKNIAVSTARAGNVIGGGDFAKDRIVPDCVRAAFNKESIIVRNPYSTRPYQHVMEPLYVYLLIACKQFDEYSLSGYYNVGPEDCDCVSTGKLVDIFCTQWGELSWENKSIGGPHEANFLKLDSSKLKTKFGWKPHFHVEEAVQKTVEWSKSYYNGHNMNECTDKQISEFFGIGR